MMTRLFRRLGLASTLAALAVTSQAASYSTSSLARVDGMDDVATQGTDFPGWAFAFSELGGGERGFARGVGIVDQVGGYSLESRSENGEATADIRYQSSFTNSLGIGSRFTMNLVVQSGHLQVGHLPFLDTQDSYFSAGYSAEVRVNGLRVWWTQSSLGRDGANVSLEREGADLNPFASADTGYFGWTAQNFEIDLGHFNHGETLNIEFVASTGTWSSPGNYSDCYNSFMYTKYITCGAVASYADPAEINGSADHPLFSIRPTQTPPVNGVPEPTGLVLMLTALTGAAMARRQRRA